MKQIRKIILKWVLQFIHDADDTEITEITQAITVRYKRKFPDWDVSFLSLPKDVVERERILTWLIDFYRSHPDA